MSNLHAVNVGDLLDRFSRATDLDNWNRFAAVNDEFVPLHMDDAAGQEAGYPTAIGMGNLQWAYMHNAVRKWIGDAGEIRSLSCQFRSANLRGMTLTVVGRVSSVEDSTEGVVVTIDLSIECAPGTTIAPGEAVVLLAPARALSLRAMPEPST